MNEKTTKKKMKLTKKEIIGLILISPTVIAALISLVSVIIYCFTHYTEASICIVGFICFFIGVELIFDGL